VTEAGAENRAAIASACLSRQVERGLSAGCPLIPNEPLMMGADPSVRLGQKRSFAERLRC
jgi:hypothetical protein